MPASEPPYPAEFRERLVDLARAGRGLTQLSREFGVRRQRHSDVAPAC